jgi:hypothetical protein
MGFGVGACYLPSITTTTTSTTTSTSSTTSTLPTLLPGKKLLLKDNATKPQKKALQVIAKDPAVDLILPGSPSDPTIVGGTLRVVGTIGTSVGGAFDDTYDLPAANWQPIKKKNPDKGYKFKKGDPIKSVLLKNGKMAKIKGKGAGLGHNLATQPNSVGVVLTIGTRTFCLGFGGEEKFKENKKLLAKNAPIPNGCPGAAASPSGAFVD